MKLLVNTNHGMEYTYKPLSEILTSQDRYLNPYCMDKESVWR